MSQYYYTDKYGYRCAVEITSELTKPELIILWTVNSVREPDKPGSGTVLTLFPDIIQVQQQMGMRINWPLISRISLMLRPFAFATQRI